jgi:hypothetical protein
MDKYIEYKGYKITYNELEEYFNEMKKKREERDEILEDISIKHEEILVNYNKTKPPIDDNSLNFFKFKTIGEIKLDNNKNLNFTLNNSLFLLLNNIIEKQKEKSILKRIETIEIMICILFGVYLGTIINFK